jgi:hypothetical protein
MSGLNPDFLLKNELRFEVAARGETPAETVADLRRQLRGLLKAKKPANVTVAVDAKQEWEFCCNLAEDLSLTLSDLSDTADRNSNAVQRLRTRLEHLERRLMTIDPVQAVGSEGEVTVPLLIQQVKENLRSLLAAPSRKKKEEVVVPEPPVVKPDESEINMVMQPTENSSGEEAAASAEIPTQLVPDLGTDKVFAATANTTYNRLPNPIGQVLERMPVTNGLDVPTLLSFLSCLLRLKELPGVNDSTLLKLVYPYCRSPLTERVSMFLDSSRNFEAFHKEILEFFVPGRLRQQLIQERFYRLQRPMESLATFAADVKHVARLLRVNSSQAEIVDVILGGLTAEERSRLIFSKKPTSFLELDELIILSRNAAYTDSLRRSSMEQEDRGGVPQVMSVQESSYEENKRRRSEVICYNCRGRGHTQRYCRSPRNAGPPRRFSEYPRNPKNGQVGEGDGN